MAGKLTQRAILMVDEEGFLLVKDTKGTEAPIPDGSVSGKEAAALRKRIEELEAQLQWAITGRDKLINQVNDLTGQLTRVKDKLKQVEADAEGVNKAYDEAYKAVERLEKELDQARKDLANTGTCPADLAQARKDIDTLRAQRDSAERNANTYRENAQRHMATIATLERQIEGLKKEMDELKKTTGNQATPNPGNPQPPSPPPQVDGTPWTPARSDTSHVWGPGRHAMESLRNLTVGRKDASHTYRMAMSFRAKSSSTPSKLWYYVPYGDGYHGNDAGIIQGTIHGDKDGAPDEAAIFGDVLRDLRNTDRSSDKMYEDSIIDGKPLEKGKLYWLVFKNNDQTVGTYYSINTTQIRKYSGHTGIRWTPAADATVLFQANPGSWINLTSVANQGDMQSSPMFQLTYRNDVKQGSAVIESGATATRKIILSSSGGANVARVIREAMYIPNTITVRAVSLMAQAEGPVAVVVGMALHKLEGDGLTNKVTGTLWSSQQTLSKVDDAPGTPAGWAASNWYDVKLPVPVTLEGGSWYALDITHVSGIISVAGQTNARRRGLEMPVAYIDGEARYSKDGTNFIPLNYHNHNAANGNRNDVNWRGIALHTVENIDSFYKQDTAAATPAPGQNPGNTGPLVPASVKEKFFTMSTGNNPRPIHGWVPGRVAGAVQNGTSGQGGGAAVNQGKSQHLTRQDGWMLQPWIDTGNLEWVLRQTFLHYTPWFVFIEADGSPNRAPGAEVAIRNLRFWVLPNGSDTWVLKSSQSTGFWCGYFHPNMSSQIGGDISGTNYEGGVKYAFKGNAWPWPAIHGSGAQYRFQDEGEFDGLLVTCEAKCLNPAAEVALQFGCDAKIFGDNKSDRVWKSESDHGWYPGVGMSRCEIITTEWKTYGFSPLQRADGSVRDGFAKNALPKARWDASKLAWDVTPELLNV